MSPPDYEAEYNNRARVPEHPELIAGWARDAAAFRQAHAEKSELGVRYGDTPRQSYDLFRPKTDHGGALVAFVHGGYWQALDPSFFSHCAQGLTTRGLPVAVTGYDLCPTVTVSRILDQQRLALADLWRRFNRPLVVAGHSAGGHLAACLLATDWPAVAPDLPERMVTSAYAISGLFDLVPLVGTSVNAALGLDETEARRMSPLLWPPPAGLTLDAVVGGEESAEYLRQSRAITAAWGEAGVVTRIEVVPGANHFTVIAPLADPDSAMVARLAALAAP